MSRNKNNEAGSSLNDTDDIILPSSPPTNPFSAPSTSTSDQSLQ